jgi:hypothetical protein
MVAADQVVPLSTLANRPSRAVAAKRVPPLHASPVISPPLFGSSFMPREDERQLSPPSLDLKR